MSGRVASPLFVQLLKYSVTTRTVTENTIKNYFLFMMESINANMAFFFFPLKIQAKMDSRDRKGKMKFVTGAFSYLWRTVRYSL